MNCHNSPSVEEIRPCEEHKQSNRLVHFVLLRQHVRKNNDTLFATNEHNTDHQMDSVNVELRRLAKQEQIRLGYDTDEYQNNIILGMRREN